MATPPRDTDHHEFDPRGVLNLASTQNGYVAALTLFVPRGIRLVMKIANNPVYWQIGWGKSLDSITWGTEVYETMGDKIRNREFDAVRFRSAVAGSPAVVNVEALPESG